MRKIIILLAFLFIVSTPTDTFAMTFSKPVNCGRIQTKDGVHFSALNALSTSQDNLFYDFGNINNLLRIYFFRNDVKVGSAVDSGNTVTLRLLGPIDVFQLPNSEKLPLYALFSYCSDGAVSLNIIGKNASGKYIKYADESLFLPMHQASILAHGDALIVNCAQLYPVNAPHKYWQYFLKWNVKEKELDISVLN